MIIEKIVIKSFGMLTDMTMEFSDTVNVIEGQNEAGKSTIAAFIKYMLYGFDADDTADSLSERRKRINWNNGTAQGSMTVRVGKKRYLINRSTVMSDVSSRTAYREDSSIIDLETGAPAFGKSPAGEVFFGVEKALFENTAFIGSLADARIEEGSVKTAIENILFSGSEKINSAKALSKIDEKMETLYHRSGGGGAIIDLMKKQEELEAKLEKSSEDNRRILSKEAELHEIREKRAEAEEKRDKLLELDACYKNVMLIQTFDKLHELEKEAENKNEVFNEYLESNKKNGFVPDDDFLKEIRKARRDADDAYRALTDASDLYTTRKNAVGITVEIENNIQKADGFGGEEQVRRNAVSLKKRTVIGTVIAILAGLLAVGSAVFEFAMKEITPLLKVLGFVGIGLFAVLALAALFVTVFGKRKISATCEQFSVQGYDDLLKKLDLIAEARSKRDGLIRDVENSSAALSDAKASYEAAQAHLYEVAVRWGDEIPENEFNRFLDELEDRVTVFLDKKHELLDEKNMVELTVKEVRRTLSDKSEIEIRAQVSPLKRKALSEINHDGIITGIADCKDEIAANERLAFEVENELSSLKTDVRDPGESYSKMRALDDKIDALKLRHKAYYLAYRTIESAQEALRSEISPRLGTYATKLMEVMTDKKYSGFEVTGSLHVTFANQAGEKKSVDFLSGGTQDLTYIAVRMALIDMLYTELPPVTFDESFAHQDNTRSTAMMKAICHLSSEGHQSFIFTCRARESALATEFDSNARIFKLSVDSDWN